MYMPNSRIPRLEPNAIYIPLTRVGVAKNLRHLTQNMLVSFALGDANLVSFALCDAKVPNANGFALQWNIG